MPYYIEGRSRSINSELRERAYDAPHHLLLQAYNLPQFQAALIKIKIPVFLVRQ